MKNLFNKLNEIFFYSQAGRIGRKNYLFGYVVIRLIQLLVITLIILLLTNYSNLFSSYFFLFLLSPCLALILLLCELVLNYLTAKRQHDLGIPSWPIMLSPRKFIQQGQKGRNQYGEEPSNNNLLDEILSFQRYYRDHIAKK